MHIADIFVLMYPERRSTEACLENHNGIQYSPNDKCSAREIDAAELVEPRLLFIVPTGRLTAHFVTLSRLEPVCS